MNATRQTGLSMVELMITLLISSFLILGITQIYIDNKRNYIYQQNQSANLENSRFALLLLEKELYKAGYRQLAQDSRDFVFKSSSTDAACPAFSAGQIIRPTTNGLGVCFRYQRADVNERDCHGDLIANDDPITIRIERVGSDLNCYVNGQGQTMLSGLNQITFEYGVDLNANRQADTYLSASDAASANNIVAVRYASLHESESANVALNTTNYNYPLANATATTATDKKLYKSVQGTTTLRNIAP
jgi:type IV pilus assembly protein PilW